MILPDVVPIPDRCRLCENIAIYISMGVSRSLCAKGLAMREECTWFALRQLDRTKT